MRARFSLLPFKTFAIFFTYTIFSSTQSKHDGWGEPAKKMGTYRYFIHAEPVQFTGFKLFYKNDLKNPPHKMLTPEDLMKAKPLPMYIQYQ